MSQNEPIDVGDDIQVSDRKNVHKTKKDQDREYLRAILSTLGGRSFLWRLLAECGVYKSSFTGNSTTFFNEGKRNIGLWLLEEIYNSDPTAYGKMRHEATERGDKK